MEIAKLTAKRSTCISKQVGCVLVDNNGRIIMTGFNGVPSGNKHCNEHEHFKNNRTAHHLWSQSNELHSEQNALAYCAKNGIKTNDSILYITLSPCIHCAKILLVAGVKKVIYDDVYDLDNIGIKFLKENGVVCEEYLPK